MTRDACTERRQCIDPTGSSNLGAVGPRLDQGVVLELAESPIDDGAVDVAEVQVLEILDQSVAIARFLGEQQQDRGQDEVAWWDELEP